MQLWTNSLHARGHENTSPKIARRWTFSRRLYDIWYKQVSIGLSSDRTKICTYCVLTACCREILKNIFVDKRYSWYNAANFDWAQNNNNANNNNNDNSTCNGIPMNSDLFIRNSLLRWISCLRVNSWWYWCLRFVRKDECAQRAIR